jgi:hypothetical protein
MRRDVEDPFGEDFVTIAFDTFGDHRSGYFFDVRATGALNDGLIPGPGLFSDDWDGIWEAWTRIERDGWTAEIRIPSRTLHFKVGLREWGFNVLRNVARDRIVFHWSGLTRDSDFLDLNSAGLLSGIAHLDQGRGLTIAPYGLARYDRAPAGDTLSLVGRGGFDLSYSLTPQLTGVATANTDFAETEVDSRQINLTRFDLFFPEKRSFFLEGSSLFDFGLGLGQDFLPFYSRRIGLIEGETVPINWGAKVLGHAGRFGIAALDIETGSSNQAPRTNLSAGRVTCDVGDSLRVGMIATHGDPEGAAANTLAGADATWHTSRIRGDKKMTVGGWTARSSGDLPSGQRHGWGLKVDFPNDFWNAYARVMEFGEALDPALGFLPRPGTRWYDVWNAVQPRPRRDGPLSFIRQAFFEIRYTQVDDLDGRTESRRLFTAPFNVETESGEHLEANWVPTYESLTAPFAVADGVVIPPGDFHFTRYRAEAQSARNRAWRIGGTVWFGDFLRRPADADRDVRQLGRLQGAPAPEARSAERLRPPSPGRLRAAPVSDGQRLRLFAAPDPVRFLPVRLRVARDGHECPPALDLPSRQRSVFRLEPQLGPPGRGGAVRPRPDARPGGAQGPLRLDRMTAARMGTFRFAGR